MSCLHLIEAEALECRLQHLISIVADVEAGDGQLPPLVQEAHQGLGRGLVEGLRILHLQHLRR